MRRDMLYLMASALKLSSGCIQEGSRAQRGRAGVNEVPSSACPNPYVWHYNQGPDCPFPFCALTRRNKILQSSECSESTEAFWFGVLIFGLLLSVMEIILKKNIFPDPALWLATGNPVKLHWINGRSHMKLRTHSSLQRNVERILTTGIVWE